MNDSFLFLVLSSFINCIFLFAFQHSLARKSQEIPHRDYIQFSLMSHILASSNIEFHKFCVPFIQKQTFSTKRDVAITSIFYREKRAVLNFFSIRQSGCQASIVILSNENMAFEEQTIKMINALDVIVAFSPIHGKLAGTHTDQIRTYFVVNFLKLHIKKYDRVFFFDSYDCFFEHDPFEYFTEPKVYLFQESLVKIKDNACNRNWIINCYGSKGLNQISNDLIVCAGTVGSGSIVEFIRLYYVLDVQDRWRKCRIDQGQLNYIIYSGLLSKYNVSYYLFSDTGPVQAIALSQKIYNYHFNNPQYQYVNNRFNQTAAVVHQYNRVESLLKSFFNRCNTSLFLDSINSNSTFVKNAIYVDLCDPIS